MLKVIFSQTFFTNILRFNILQICNIYFCDIVWFQESILTSKIDFMVRKNSHLTTNRYKGKGVGLQFESIALKASHQQAYLHLFHLNSPMEHTAPAYSPAAIGAWN